MIEHAEYGPSVTDSRAHFKYDLRSVRQVSMPTSVLLGQDHQTGNSEIESK